MITCSLLDGPVTSAPDGVVVIAEALVPLLWWRGVRLVAAEPVAMTPLERFALELALADMAEPDEFAEITGLDAGLLAVAARRLVAAGVLSWSDRGYVAHGGAEAVKETALVQEPRRTTRDVVLLPRSGDLVVLTPRTSGLRDLEKLRLTSVGNAPLPAGLIGITLQQHLHAQLRTGTAAGITGLVPDIGNTEMIGRDGWCPTYRAAGELRLHGGDPVPTLTFSKRSGGGSATLELPGATGLAQQWLAVFDAAEQERVMAEIGRLLLGQDDGPGPQLRRIGIDRWVWPIDTAQAERLSGRGRNLALPAGVRLAADGVAAVEVAVELVGADRGAVELVALDRSITDAAGQRADTSTLSRTVTVRDRAWELGFLGLVCAMREAEDFDYA